MNRLFNYHIDKKQMTPQLVRRSLKILIEQFDPEKIYLLDEEVQAILNISDETVRQMIQNYYKGSFEGFEEVIFRMQEGVLRAQNYRKSLKQEIISYSFNDQKPFQQTGYAENKQELFRRQKYRIYRFFAYHQERSGLKTKEKREKAYRLFEGKMRQWEFPYLYLSSNGEAMSNKRSEHVFSEKLLKAMAKSLDAHTSFFTEEEAYEMRMNLEKQFEGVGIVLSEGIEGVMIADVIKNSPAHKSKKIEANDLIISINGHSLENLSFDQVLELMKSRESSSISLGILRSKNQKKIEVKLKKEPIVMQEDRLSYEIEPYGNGVIAKLTMGSFYENGDDINSEKDIRRALQEISRKGPILGVILDLRENSGGFLSQAIKVAGLFISSGVVAISKYGNNDVHYLRKVDIKSYYNGPLVILTSKLSASAAEIVSQALQDYGAAIIVGDDRTFGKGSIQYQTVTDESADLFFKVTVGKYYTVSGRSTQVDGVKADIVVPSALSVYNIGERFLEYPLPADRISPAFQDRLQGLDSRTKAWFQSNYLPYLQKQIVFWKRMLPLLKINCTYRIAHSKGYQAFLESLKINADPYYKGRIDLQMHQALDIVRDMIYMEIQTRVQSEKAFSKRTNSQK